MFYRHNVIAAVFQSVDCAVLNYKESSVKKSANSKLWLDTAEFFLDKVSRTQSLKVKCSHIRRAQLGLAAAMLDLPISEFSRLFKPGQKGM